MRMKREDHRRAYFVAALLSTQTKEPVTPDMLYEPLWYSSEEIEKRKNERLLRDHETLKKEFGL